MGRFDDAYEWGITLLFLLIILYVASVFITSFCEESGLFCYIIFSGGIIAVIIASIKKLLS